ncbi:hypothetical protein BS47DRAFT_1377504 [Hydnum rufescens UP504]|uniref:Coatomer subunit delta n=1 Tax=Hydnum rufescens UP504 TaxID=1448309 RepID=A0A9P6DQG0_9AGAM|nr:hypothetical protein BS47DRAFT_1377504 [Hydnum rufescens UP504]
MRNQQSPSANTEVYCQKQFLTRPPKMVVLATSIVTKGVQGDARSRIEGLLTSFPKLIPANSQHTSVETADVRYVYQPLEDLYILLITNKASNILQDIDTLHLVTRVVSDICRNAGEKEILRHAFELLGAFDEIISLGYREQVNLLQVRNVLEMESHEEKIQDIISRNKEAEAKEELKRRAKQLELQRREQARRAAATGGSHGGFGGLGGGISGYAPLPRYDVPVAEAPRIPYTSPTPAKSPAFKGSGMKLGKKPKQLGLLDSFVGEVVMPEEPSTSASVAPTPEPALEVSQVALPTVTRQIVHVSTREHLSLTLLQAGGVKQFELKGDLNLLISDPSAARVKLALDPLSELASSLDTKALQFKYHPNLARSTVQGLEREIKLKDPSRTWPVGTPLGKDESLVPLSINCWPSVTGEGTCDVNIEYELENDSMDLINLAISIPLPEGAYPTVTSYTGNWTIDPSTHSLRWTVLRISSSDGTRSGSLEFSVGGEDPTVFFPVKVNFTGLASLIGITVQGVSEVESGAETPFSQETSLATDDYLVV